MVVSSRRISPVVRWRAFTISPLHSLGVGRMTFLSFTYIRHRRSPANRWVIFCLLPQLSLIWCKNQFSSRRIIRCQFCIIHLLSHGFMEASTASSPRCRPTWSICGPCLCSVHACEWAERVSVDIGQLTGHSCDIHAASRRSLAVAHNLAYRSSIDNWPRNEWTCCWLIGLAVKTGIHIFG